MALSFDGENSLVILSEGTTRLDLRELWSRWLDWLSYGDNNKYLVAMRTVGGDDIDPDTGTIIPIYLFLVNGWRIKPQEAHHTLNVVNGILLVDGGGDPFINTLGDFIVRINYQQPVQAISFIVTSSVSVVRKGSAVMLGISEMTSSGSKNARGWV